MTTCANTPLDSQCNDFQKELPSGSATLEGGVPAACDAEAASTVLAETAADDSCCAPSEILMSTKEHVGAARIKDNQCDDGKETSIVVADKTAAQEDPPTDKDIPTAEDSNSVSPHPAVPPPDNATQEALALTVENEATTLPNSVGGGETGPSPPAELAEETVVPQAPHQALDNTTTATAEACDESMARTESPDSCEEHAETTSAEACEVETTPPLGPPFDATTATGCRNDTCEDPTPNKNAPESCEENVETTSPGSLDLASERTLPIDTSTTTNGETGDEQPAASDSSSTKDVDAIVDGAADATATEPLVDSPAEPSEVDVETAGADTAIAMNTHFETRNAEPHGDANESRLLQPPDIQGEEHLTDPQTLLSSVKSDGDDTVAPAESGCRSPECTATVEALETSTEMPTASPRDVDPAMEKEEDIGCGAFTVESHGASNADDIGQLDDTIPDGSTNAVFIPEDVCSDDKDVAVDVKASEFESTIERSAAMDFGAAESSTSTDLQAIDHPSSGNDAPTCTETQCDNVNSVVMEAIEAEEAPMTEVANEGLSEQEQIASCSGPEDAPPLSNLDQTDQGDEPSNPTGKDCVVVLETVEKNEESLEVESSRGSQLEPEAEYPRDPCPNDNDSALLQQSSVPGDAGLKENGVETAESSRGLPLEPEAKYPPCALDPNDKTDHDDSALPQQSSLHGDAGFNEGVVGKPDPPEIATADPLSIISVGSSEHSRPETVQEIADTDSAASNKFAPEIGVVTQTSDTTINESLGDKSYGMDETASLAPTNSHDAVEAVNGASDENMMYYDASEVSASAVEPDDDCSYEEIVVEDDEEMVEYVDEILDEYEEEIDEESFTEVTYDSKNCQDDELQKSRGSITVDASIQRRLVIKSSAQKALEIEEARKLKEAEETRKNMEYRLARQHSFARKDEDLKRRLEEEEARHLREEEERERQRVNDQIRLAEIRAQEAAARIARQETAELRRRLEEEEARRKVAEAEAHRLAAEAAAKEKLEAERLRREAEEQEKRARDEKKRQMEEEIRKLQEKLAATKRAAEEAKAKQLEEQRRTQAVVDGRRKEKKVKKKKAESSVPRDIRSSSDDQSQAAELNASASSIRGPSPTPILRVPVVSKSPVVEAQNPEPPVSPLRSVRSFFKAAPKSPAAPPKSPAAPPKSPMSASPRRLVMSASPTKPATPPTSRQHVPSPTPPKAAAPPSVPTLSTDAPKADPNKVYYSVDQLRKQSVPGLDYKNREQYLHPDEFQAIFEMSPAEFFDLPAWKQTNLKRKKKLF